MRWSRTAAVAALTLCAFVFAAPVAAFGHAYLIDVTPGDGEVLQDPPDEVRIVFNEPVELPTGGLRVFDRDVTRVDEGRVDGTSADEIAVELPELDDGGYVVSYRVISADGHPVAGVTTFSVGDDAVDADVVAQVASDAESPLATALGRGLRALGYAAGLLAVGSLVFATLVASDVTDRRRCRVVGVAAGLVAALVAMLAIPVQAVTLSGAVSAAVDPGLVTEVVASSFGLAAVLRVVALLSLVALWAAAAPVAAWVPAAAVIGSYLLDGHQRTTEPAAVVAAADAVHLAAASVWFAGVVLLAWGIRRRGEEHPARAAELVSRFSTVALVSVVLLTLAGVAMAVPLVGTPGALTSTTYGWLLLAKTGVVLVVLVVAVVNRRALLPRVVAAEAGEVPAAWRRLTSALRIEAVLLVGVLAVTGVLSSTQPASEAAGLGGWYEVTAELGEDEVVLVVDPNRVGRNTLHLFVLDATGRPSEDVEEVTLQLSFPGEDLGPIPVEPNFAGPGHWIASIDDLVFAGDWEFRIVAGYDRFTEVSTRVVVPVAG